MQNYQANTAYKNSTTLPLLSEIPAAIGTFPISQTLATQSTSVGTWPQVSRPTLTGGVAGGRIAGTRASEVLDDKLTTFTRAPQVHPHK